MLLANGHLNAVDYHYLWSTATVERSFSSLRSLKTYLRSTMSQQRLDDLAILYIERDRFGNLSSLPRMPK